jgi:hypothetical protein
MYFIGRLLLAIISVTLVVEIIYGYSLYDSFAAVGREPITVGTEVEKALKVPGKLSAVVDTVLTAPIEAPTPADRLPPPLPPTPKKETAKSEDTIVKAAETKPVNVGNSENQTSALPVTAPTNATAPPILAKPKATAPPPPPMPRAENSPVPPPSTAEKSAKPLELAAASIPKAEPPKPAAEIGKKSVTAPLPLKPEPPIIVRPELAPVSTPMPQVEQAINFLHEMGATIKPATDRSGQALTNRFEVTIDPNPDGGISRLNPRTQRELAQQIAKMGDSLYSLNLKHLGIGNFANFGPMEGLLKLDVTGSDFLNINPLTRWPKLEELNVSGTHVDNMNLAAQITPLRVLNLSGSNTFDIGPLAVLVGLEELYLADTKISNVLAAGSLIRLRTLDIAGTAVADIAPLSGAWMLQRLSLARTPVTDIRTLAQCRRLAGLDLSGCLSLKSLEGLQGLDLLETISLFQVPVSDLSPLSSLLKLTTLELSRSGIKDCAGLVLLSNPQNLYLRGLTLENSDKLLMIKTLKLVDLTGSIVSGGLSIEELASKLENAGVKVMK